MVYRCILANWAFEENPSLKKVVEGDLTEEELQKLNSQGYNIYFLPNSPAEYNSSKLVDGTDIDLFSYVFVDMDLKDGVYKDKTSFVEEIQKFTLPPTVMVDSGNGIHVYWAVTDLDALSFLKLQRRLMRKFKTDAAVAKIYQLMRMPETMNMKVKEEPKLCTRIYSTDAEYSCEQLDAVLPALTKEDSDYCQRHYETTYSIVDPSAFIAEIPLKFDQLLQKNTEVKDIWSGNVEDRSKGDYRLGHLMYADGFTKSEALAVLVHCEKARTRAPTHRVNYAQGIVDKVWEFEAPKMPEIKLSSSVREILSKYGSEIKGTRFPCYSYIDATEHGFRLGQVIGLVAGSGVGKTAMALNMFKGFVQNNPDYDHFFIPLEQPAHEIADRWRTMCGNNTRLHDKVQVISNYEDTGAYRNLSFDEIKTYLLEYQTKTGRKVGAVVIDHIGALRKKGKNGENQDLMDICHKMKAFAIETNTLLIMQSQAPREKAGAGDLELGKDAAYGSVFFESYCDYLITIWQPLKLCYGTDGCPTVTAFKFCKIRHKKQHKDKIQEDNRYLLYFDPKNEHFREMTQDEETSFVHWNNRATNLRKLDRKTEVLSYKSITWTKDVRPTTTDNH